MDFDLSSGLVTLKKKYCDLPSKSIDEENTKTWFILPFFGYLGYDFHDPNSVEAQYSPDPEYKRTGKVDYAIFDQHGKPIIYVECKKLCEPLDSHRPQLKNYFNNSPSVKFALLTNGYEYRFYTDLERKNVMDKQPFLSFNLETNTDKYLEHLSVFMRKNFSTSDARSLVEKLSRRSKVVKYLENEIKNPSDDLVKLITKNALGTTRTSKAVLSEIKASLTEIFDELLEHRDIDNGYAEAPNQEKSHSQSEQSQKDVDNGYAENLNHVGGITPKPQEESNSVNIFDIKNPTYQNLEYFVFNDKKIECSKMVNMFVYVIKNLFQKDNSLAKDSLHGYITKSPPENRSYRELSDDYFLVTHSNSREKFKLLREILTAFDMKDALRIKMKNRG